MCELRSTHAARLPGRATKMARLASGVACFAVAAALQGLTAGAAPAASTAKPNVVMIVIDGEPG